MVEDIISPEIVEFVGDVLTAQPVPETYPAHGPVLGDPAGYIWVQRYATPLDSVTRWFVFEPDGRAVGAVTTPAGVEVYEVGEDYLMGLWRDELDVEYVRVYEIVGR